MRLWMLGGLGLFGLGSLGEDKLCVVQSYVLQRFEQYNHGTLLACSFLPT